MSACSKAGSYDDIVLFVLRMYALEGSVPFPIPELLGRA